MKSKLDTPLHSSLIEKKFFDKVSNGFATFRIVFKMWFLISQV